MQIIKTDYLIQFKTITPSPSPDRSFGVLSISIHVGDVAKSSSMSETRNKFEILNFEAPTFQFHVSFQLGQHNQPHCTHCTIVLQ